MALKYYQNYLNNLAQAANESYRGLVQAFNDSQWDNTTQRYNILEQSIIGSSIYNPIDIQVDYAIERGTGLKKSDDYKTFNFKDVVHDVEYGLLYKYDDLTWMTIDKSEIGSVFQSITVRRCNNIAKWIDPISGALIEEPCVIDYDMGSARPKVDKDIITPDNSMVLIIQGNDRTRKLKQTQRFIFNGRAFKLGGFNTSLQNDIVTNATTLYYYDLYEDTEKPKDDLMNNIADRYEYIYSINIIQDVKEQVNGFVGKLNADVMLNGSIIDRNITWVGNDYVTILNGQYTLHGNVGNVAQIRAYIDGNNDIYDEVNIKIVGTVADVYDIVVNSLYADIKQGQTVTFRADLYKNGVIQSNVVNAITGGVPSECYSFNIVNNVCTLSCSRFSTSLLNIEFTSGQYNKTIQIKLKSAF